MTGFGQTAPVAFIVYLVVVNVAAFAAFGADKRRAQRGAWRIPEKALLALAVIGGSVGALAGMRVFHHKTQKPLFSLGVPIILIAHLALAAALVFTGCQDARRQGTDEFQAVTVNYVIDGDTIDVIMDGSVRRVRLTGVDAPESVSHQVELNCPEGDLASEFVRGLVPEGSVVFLQKETTETDKYNRLLRYVWLDIPNNPADPNEVRAKMLNAIIVEAGFAEAKGYWPDVSYERVLEDAEARAVAEGAGVSYLWANG